MKKLTLCFVCTTFLWASVGLAGQCETVANWKPFSNAFVAPGLMCAGDSGPWYCGTKNGLSAISNDDPTLTSYCAQISSVSPQGCVAGRAQCASAKATKK